MSVIIIPVCDRDCDHHHIALGGEGAVFPLLGKVAQENQELTESMKEGHLDGICPLIRHASRGVP